ncbi:MAG: PspA/IM30 family protein [Phycisphaerae bacterium]
MRHTLLLGIAVLTVIAAPFSASADDVHTFTIQNPLNLHWPWELTHKDFPAGTLDADEDWTVTMNGETRPAQLEQATKRDGTKVDRLWFVATVPKRDGRSESGTQVVVRPGKEYSPLSVKRDGRFVVLGNGRLSLVLQEFTAKGGGVPLKDAKHWFSGLGLDGRHTSFGRAKFSGFAKVSRSRIKVLRQGPVFCDVAIEYDFEGAKVSGKTPAVPMTPGKRSHTYKPNEIPTEMVPQESPHYRVVLRMVMGDPWVELVERYHLPDEAGHELHFGKEKLGKPGESMKVDTTLRVRWFEYDSFGGNTSLNVGEAKPRDIQKGREYARLQPRWTQRGGGAQELLLTSGGKNPDDPNAPCVGIVATFAGKWVSPYQGIIQGHVADGNRGWYEFPLHTGSGGGKHYGQRSYAIVAGPRKRFDSTNKLNGLIRRHTDWTLVAEMNKYILHWKRDPTKAGPHILMSPERLDRIKKDWQSGEQTGVTRAMKRTKQRLIDAAAQAKKLEADIADLQTKLKQADDDKRKAELKTRLDRAKKQRKRIGKTLRGTDAKLLAFITEGESGGGKLPDVGIWIGRRYQDDFLNPTTYTRRVHGWGWPDLYAAGSPIGGPIQAAAGYIFSDPDHWPGWHNGWNPGNPNFHTDKYIVALYAGAALRDHPHSDEWLEFGLRNFRDDLARVLLKPDGVGWECPGYSGYSLNLQLKVARVIANTGYGNPITSNPMTRATGVWHRKLITPPDSRIGMRHEAPHGDTHRWTSGMKFGFARLADYYSRKDPAFASEMMGTWQLLIDSGMYGGRWEPSLKEAVLETDLSIQPTDAAEMDWSSQAFYGFGAILRDEFGTAGESFCSLKAGPARGHYHNDELAYHFYSGRTPISLDYNCSYHPRADHACLHNSMTFGRQGTVRHNARNKPVTAHEQLWGTARVGAFETSKLADVVVAERTSSHLTMSPIDPHDHEFSRRYPSRKIQQTTHRRTLAMVKHDKADALGDYLVVLDQTTAKEPQQLNVHLLARSATVNGRTITLDGQLDKDIAVHLAAATDPNIQVRSYHYLANEKRPGPALYAIRPGESAADYRKRLQTMMDQAGATSLPIDGLDATGGLSRDQWHERVKKTGGKALAVPPFWNGEWTEGEYQVWLRVETTPGKPILWVLAAWDKKEPAPTIETVHDGAGVKLTAGDTTETVRLTGSLSKPKTLVLTRDGETRELIDLSQLPAMGEIPRKPLGSD